ncbi:phage tail family protein [Clostridium perfringens]|nr:phage tail family protein [Clostridium perfringens]
MYKKLFIIFNNMNSYEDLGLSIVRRPNIPSPTKNKTTKEVPGRDGLLYEVLKGYKDITIPIEFNFIDRTNLKERFRQVKSWINDIEDNKLIFSDDIEWFYRVVDVNLNGDFETILRRKGLFKIDFTCRAYNYTIDGNSPLFMDNNSTLYNCYLPTEPLIKVTGHGEVNISINNKTFTVDVSDYVYIDSELELAYRNKGNYFNIGKGKFPILQKGTNTITYSSNVTQFEITPRWRCL